MSWTSEKFKEEMTVPKAAARLISSVTDNLSLTEKDLKPCDLGQKLTARLNTMFALEEECLKEPEGIRVWKDLIDRFCFWQDEESIYVLFGLTSQADFEHFARWFDLFFLLLAELLESEEIEKEPSLCKKRKKIEAILFNLSDGILINPGVKRKRL